MFEFGLGVPSDLFALHLVQPFVAKSARLFGYWEYLEVSFFHK